MKKFLFVVVLFAGLSAYAKSTDAMIAPDCTIAPEQTVVAPASTVSAPTELKFQPLAGVLQKPLNFFFGCSCPPQFPVLISCDVVFPRNGGGTPIFITVCSK